MTNDRRLSVAAVRAAVERLIARGTLANPQQLRPSDRLLVLDIDDHVSDETISGGRVRVVLRSSKELRDLAAELENAAVFGHHLTDDDDPF